MGGQRWKPGLTIGGLVSHRKDAGGDPTDQGGPSPKECNPCAGRGAGAPRGGRPHVLERSQDGREH